MSPVSPQVQELSDAFAAASKLIYKDGRKVIDTLIPNRGAKRQRATLMDELKDLIHALDWYADALAESDGAIVDTKSSRQGAPKAKVAKDEGGTQAASKPATKNTPAKPGKPAEVKAEVKAEPKVEVKAPSAPSVKAASARVRGGGGSGATRGGSRKVSKPEGIKVPA